MFVQDLIVDSMVDYLKQRHTNDEYLPLYHFITENMNRYIEDFIEKHSHKLNDFDHESLKEVLFDELVKMIGEVIEDNSLIKWMVAKDANNLSVIPQNNFQARKAFKYQTDIELLFLNILKKSIKVKP